MTGPVPRRRTLARLGPFLRPQAGKIALAALFLLLAAGASLSIPLALRQLIDGGLAAAAPDRMAVITRHFGTMAALALAFAAFTATRFYLVSWIGERITSDLREAVYRNVLRQRPAFFETLQTGEVLSRLSADATLVQTVVGSSASIGLRSLVTAVGALGLAGDALKAFGHEVSHKALVSRIDAWLSESQPGQIGHHP